jgi:acyl carrier protein
MERKEIFEILNEIFREVFDDEEIVLTDETTADDIEDWDSLEQINLVVACEKRFNVKFEMKEIQLLKNVGEMVDCILVKKKKQ